MNLMTNKKLLIQKKLRRKKNAVVVAVSNLTQLLEPMLILFMGAVIGVIIIAILMGILSVNNLAL